FDKLSPNGGWQSAVLARLGGRRRRLGGAALGPRPGVALDRGGRELGRVHRAGLVGIGGGELGLGLHRPFVERQHAVMVGVELGIGLAALGEIFLARHLAVAVLVIAVEPLLLACAV